MMEYNLAVPIMGVYGCGKEHTGVPLNTIVVIHVHVLSLGAPPHAY